VYGPHRDTTHQPRDVRRSEGRHDRRDSAVESADESGVASAERRERHWREERAVGSLCATGAIAEADSLICATIARISSDMTLPASHHARSVLGFGLTRAGRYAEAEEKLLEGAAGLHGSTWSARRSCSSLWIPASQR
jgi:hypothetical protein